MAQKILIVDDDAETRRILGCVLAPVGAVLEACGGEEALRLIGSERPQLLLLDVVMPAMGGLEVLQSALALIPTLAVVMLSGQADIAVAKSSLDRGARAYITKPVDPQELREVIGDLLGVKGDSADAGDRNKPWRVVG